MARGNSVARPDPDLRYLSNRRAALSVENSKATNCLVRSVRD
jgi:hypothetical protein